MSFMNPTAQERKHTKQKPHTHREPQKRRIQARSFGVLQGAHPQAQAGKSMFARMTRKEKNNINFLQRMGQRQDQVLEISGYQTSNEASE